MKTKLKKIVALTLIVVLTLSIFSMGSAIGLETVNPNNAIQIEKNSNNADDGYAYYSLNKDGSRKELSDSATSYVIDEEKGDVKTSKTITPTDKENEFEIKLEVTTTEKFHELNLSDDAAVVLVLDCSGSMQWDMDNGGYCQKEGCKNFGKYVKSGQNPWQHFWGEPSRFELMSESLLGNETSTGFLNDFADAKDAERMVSVVYFGQSVNSDKTIGWTDVTSTEGLGQIREAVSFDTLKSDIWSQTSQGAGLAEAINLLENDEAIKDIPNRYVVLLTDGRPEGPYPDGSYAEKQAKIVKEDYNTLLYAIGFGTKDITMLRDDKKPVNKWLEEDVASPNSFVAAQSGEELDLGLGSLTQTIKNVSNAWRVTDPMGENIIFDGFITEDAPATVSDGVIEWDLTKMTPVESEDGTNKYTLSYKVRLDNTAEDFDASKYYATNGYTSVSYFYTEDVYEDGKVVSSNKDAIKEHAFNVPSVRGYSGVLNVQKVEELESGEYNSLEGAVFELRHEGKDCSICNGEAKSVNVMTGTTDSNGKVTFANIPSGHEYTLVETTSPDGYKKYEKEYKVKVEYGVVKVDGKTVGENDSVVVKNVPFDPVTVDLSGIKLFDNKTPDNNEFEFKLEKVNDDGSTEVLQTVNNNKSSFAFEPLTFDADGIYTYLVTEVKGGSDDIVYDSTEYRVVINVNKDYELEKYVADVTITKASAPNDILEKITFDNVSRTPVDVNLVAEKLLNGKEPNTNEFEFTLAQKDAEGEYEVLQTVNNDGKAVVFDKLTFDKAGEYEFVIDELDGENPDVVYDKAEYTVKVIVEPDKNGDGYVTEVVYVNEAGERLDKAVFGNRNRDFVAVELVAEKLFDDKAPTTNEFEFTLAQKDAAGEYTVLQTINNDGKAVVFNKLTFDKAGEYEFVIDELVGENPDVVYDNVEYGVKVIVEPDKDSDGYVTTVVYTNEAGETVNKAVFNNVSRTPVDVELSAEKLFDGEEPTTNEFEFTLAQKDAAGEYKVLQTVNNDGKAVVFEKLTFDKAGEYEFVIDELVGENPDVVYDKAEYRVRVIVDPEKDGDGYVATVVYSNEASEAVEKAVFNNASRTPADVELAAEKLFDGKEPTTNEFEFTLAQKDEAGEYNVLQTVNNDGKAVVFEKLTFDKAGEYEFVIDELVGENPDVVYDKSEYGVKVIVEPDKNGDGYVTTVVYTGKDGKVVDKAVFNNVSRTPVDVELVAEKIFDGEEPQTNEFEFTLAQKDAAGEYKVLQTVNNDGKAVVFNKLTFDKAGEYEFVIDELVGENPDVVYDKAEYSVKVVVHPEVDGNGYVTTVVYTNEAGETVGKAVFNNVSRTPVDVELSAEKIFDGKAPTTNEFEFTLAQKDAAGEYKVLQTVNNDGKAVVFEKLTFDKAGEYEFVIDELVGENPDVVYDKAEYSVKVIVEPEKDGDGYVATVVYTNEDGGEVETAVFDNVSRTPVDVELVAEKLFDGEEPQTDEFEFTLAQKNAAGEYKVLQTVNNDGKAVVFEKLTFDKAGEYEFVIDELVGNNPDVFYDKAEYGVKVIVEPDKNGDGYVTTVVYSGKDGKAVEKAVFNNVSREPIAVELVANKVVDRYIPKTNEYEFTLLQKDVDGEYKVIQTVNNKKRDVIFDEIVFDKAGEYEFKIVEVVGNDVDMVYDRSEYYAKVIVEPHKYIDEYVAKVVYTNEAGERINTPVFYNVSRTPATAQIHATKLLDGKFASGNDFEFALYAKDAEGKYVEIESVKNVGKDIDFSKLTFEKAGTYEFKVVEVKGDRDDVDYDETAYYVTVNVSANEETDGYVVETVVLKSGDKEYVAYEEGTIVFSNTTIEVPPETGDANNPIVWMNAMLVALMMTAFTGIRVRRNKQK